MPSMSRTLRVTSVRCPEGTSCENHLPRRRLVALRPKPAINLGAAKQNVDRRTRGLRELPVFAVGQHDDDGLSVPRHDLRLDLARPVDDGGKFALGVLQRPYRTPGFLLL